METGEVYFVLALENWLNDDQEIGDGFILADLLEVIWFCQ